MNDIELALREKSHGRPQSILMAQWEFDKVILPATLRAVANLFPHYSLHDETHSLSILNNIVKILGKEVVMDLSCTDLWLLLESAYCHDLGMVVTSKRVQEKIGSDEFLVFFTEIASDSKHKLYVYTEPFEIRDRKIFLKEQPRLRQCV